MSNKGRWLSNSLENSSVTRHLPTRKVPPFSQILSRIQPLLIPLRLLGFHPHLGLVGTKGAHHDISGGTACINLGLHEVHIGGDMGEELAVAGAEIVEARLAVAVGQKAVLGTLTVTGEEPAALAALAGQRRLLLLPKLALAVAVEQGGEGLLADVAQAVLRPDKMVARVDGAVGLHHGGLTAGGRHRADAGRHTAPVGQGGIEELNEHTPDVAAYPLVIDGAEESSPLVGGDAAVGLVGFHNGRELQEFATDLSEKFIEPNRAFDIGGINRRHRVPLHLVTLKEGDASHHVVPRAATEASPHPPPTGGGDIVQRLGTIDADTHEEMVVVEETAPLIGEQRAVGLQAVVNVAITGVLLLQFQGFFIEGEWTQQRFAAVPSEEYIRGGLRLDILAGKLLQQGVIHHATAAFVQIVAVVTPQVAPRTHGLQHDVHRTAERHSESQLLTLHFPLFTSHFSLHPLSDN